MITTSPGFRGPSALASAGHVSERQRHPSSDQQPAVVNRSGYQHGPVDNQPNPNDDDNHDRSSDDHATAHYQRAEARSA